MDEQRDIDSDAGHVLTFPAKQLSFSRPGINISESTSVNRPCRKSCRARLRESALPIPDPPRRPPSSSFKLDEENSPGQRPVLRGVVRLTITCPTKSAPRQAAQARLYRIFFLISTCSSGKVDLRKGKAYAVCGLINCCR